MPKLTKAIDYGVAVDIACWLFAGAAVAYLIIEAFGG